MAALYHSLFTEKGLELLRESIQTGTKLGITHMSFGDGNGELPVPDAKFTKMVKEVYRVALNRLAPSKENANWLEADGIIPSAVGGFNIREVGLWAGNVMVAYANYPPTYKPTGDQGTAQIKTIRIVLQIDNTANFELKIDASVVMATVQYVNDSLNRTITSVLNIEELKKEDTLIGKKVYVRSVGKHYSFINDSEHPSNNYSIIESNNGGFWELELLEKYYASDFAIPNLIEDQSQKIQQAFAYATSKNRKFIIDDIFYGKSINKAAGSTIPTVLYMLNKSKMEFINNGEIRLITENKTLSNILLVNNIEDFEIIKPRLVGDRMSNTLVDRSNGSAEWGYGLTIYSSKNGYVFEPSVQNCMGDGIYVGKAWGSNTNKVPEDISIIRPKVDRVRRNGISLTSGKNVYIQKPIVSNVTSIDGIDSTAPSSGIDIEPESALSDPPPYIEDCIIEDPTLINCNININFWNQFPNATMKLHVKGNTNIYCDFENSSGLWLGNEENQISGYLNIDRVIYHSHIEQALYTKVIQRDNFKINIGELHNNTDGILDIIYGKTVSESANYGSLEIQKLSVSKASASWVLAQNYAKSTSTSDLIIRDIHCDFGLYSAGEITTPQRGKNYLVGYTTKVSTSIDSLFIPGNTVIHKPTDANAEIFLNKSYNTQKVILDPLSIFPLKVTGLRFNNAGGAPKNTITLTKPGSSVTLKKQFNDETLLIEATGEWQLS